MAYGLHEIDREFRAIVLDLGGGTFDVTVLEVMEGVIEIQGDKREQVRTLLEKEGIRTKG